MGTETFAFSVTFSNGVFEITQPTNGNLVASFPEASAVIKTHPSIANYYYFGSSGNILTFDYTLCSNLTTVSRQLQIEAIIALGGGSLGSVTIAGQPISTTISGQPIGMYNNPLLSGGMFSLSASTGSTANLLVLRLNHVGGVIRLLNLSAATSAALSAGQALTLQLGTVTGGTWATPAGLAGTNIQSNTGGTLAATNNTIIAPYNSAVTIDLSRFNIAFGNLVAFWINTAMSGLGTTNVALSWTES